jgi:hypothetical protein
VAGLRARGSDSGGACGSCGPIAEVVVQIFDAKEPMVSDFELAARTGSPPELGRARYCFAYTLLETGPRESAGAIEQQVWRSQESYPGASRPKQVEVLALGDYRRGRRNERCGGYDRDVRRPFDVGAGDIEFQPAKPGAPLLVVAELGAPNETVGTDPGVVTPSPTRMCANIKPRPIIGRVDRCHCSDRQVSRNRRPRCDERAQGAARIQELLH